MCPICSNPNAITIFELDDVPVHVATVLTDPRRARATPRGDIELVACDLCGHVWNRAFDPTLLDYTNEYDASLDHSPTYRDFLSDVVERLVTELDLEGKTVVEVGCGRGAFLRMLARRAAGTGIGIDPSAPDTDPELTFIVEHFDRDHVEQLTRVEPGVMASRQMLHYVADPVGFVRLMSEVGSPLYLEIPNAEWVLASGMPWTVFYEHVGYFAPSSLEHLFRRAGRTGASRPTYEAGQYLSIEDGTEPGTAEPPIRIARSFGERAREMIDRWADHVTSSMAAGRRLAVWGAAGRGATFVNAMPSDSIIAVADNNTARHGTFVPGTGTPVVAPDRLPDFDVDEILLTNSTYRSEIEAQIRELGIDADLTPVDR